MSTSPAQPHGGEPHREHRAALSGRTVLLDLPAGVVTVLAALRTREVDFPFHGPAVRVARGSDPGAVMLADLEEEMAAERIAAATTARWAQVCHRTDDVLSRCAARPDRLVPVGVDDVQALLEWVNRRWVSMRLHGAPGPGEVTGRAPVAADAVVGRAQSGLALLGLDEAGEPAPAGDGEQMDLLTVLVGACVQALTEQLRQARL